MTTIMNKPIVFLIILLIYQLFNPQLWAQSCHPPSPSGAGSPIGGSGGPGPGGGCPGGGGSQHGQMGGGANGGGLSWTVRVIASRDPNDINGPVGFGDERWVSVNDVLDYRIRYENDPKLATASANYVIITYPIDINQNLFSFRLGSFGFNGMQFQVPQNVSTFSQRLNLISTQGIYVDVTAGIDVVQNRAFWIFETIDPATGLPPTDPLMGFLPVKDSTVVSTDSLGIPGDGFVNFTIKPRQTSATGDTTLATAVIVFDTNEEIPTNNEVHTIDARAPISNVGALPPISNSTSISLAVDMNDDPGGCGVKDYDLYVSADNGNYTLYLSDQTSPIIQFTGANGVQYKFYTLARDNVGNQEIKTQPDAETTIIDNSINLPPQFSLNGAPVNNFSKIVCGNIETTLCFKLTDPESAALTNSFSLLPLVGNVTFNVINDSICITYNSTSQSGIASAALKSCDAEGNCTTLSLFFETRNAIPSFASIQPLCSGGESPILPTTSTNGITGTWSPSIISNTQSDTYNFTPSAGQCATSATMTINVNPNVTPTFNQVDPICAGGSLSALPTTSNNGILGIWTPEMNNVSTTVYTFTPTAGQCATSTTMTITVNPNVTPTSVNGPSAVCRNQSFVFTTDALVDATSYQWILPVGMTGTSTNNSITVATSSTFTGGNICVKAVNQCGPSAQVCKTLTVITATSATPGTISGTTSVCANSTENTYTIAAVANASNYIWTAPSNATLVSGQGTTTATFSFQTAYTTGSISVKSSNCFGTSAARTLTVTKKSISATPGTVTGPASFCAGTQQTYSIAAVSGASNYTWTAPANASIVSGQGSLSVIVEFTPAFVSGNVTVASSNCSGTSAARTLTVTKKAISATPGTVTGPASFCPGTQQTFSIVAVANASEYTWTAPANASIVSGQGSLSVVVEFTSAFVSGNVTVASSNCSGTSAARTKSVTRTTLPATVGTISGVTAGACSANTRTYTIVAVSNTNSYEWTAPVNASIESGQGSTSVVVQFAAGFTTGTLSVKGVNCSGTSVTARTLTLTKVTSTPSVLTGNFRAVCAGSTQTYSTTAVTGATSYVWTVPTGAVINGASNGTSISVTFPSPFTSGVVSVKSATACYTSSAKSLTVYAFPGTPTSITGPLTGVCSGSTQTYTCTASTTGATGYNWTVPAGANILTGATTNSITVQFPTPFISGTVSVKAYNTCGESAAKSVTVRSVLSQPGSITGTSTNLCGGGSYTYTIAAVTGATGYFWSVPTGWTISANTGTSITVSIPTTTFSTATLSVAAQNDCGNGTVRTLTLSALPATPTAIAGSNSVCPSASGLVYSTPAVSGVSYTWTVPTGASITAGQGTSSIEVTWGTVAGSVTVKAKNACGTNNTAKTLAVTLASCRLGEELAEETSLNTDLRVYPNPTAGNATVVFETEAEGKYTLNVLNILGQVVYSKTASSVKGENTLSIDISELSSGLYFINLMEESGMRSLRLEKK